MAQDRPYWNMDIEPFLNSPASSNEIQSIGSLVESHQSHPSQIPG